MGFEWGPNGVRTGCERGLNGAPGSERGTSDVRSGFKRGPNGVRTALTIQEITSVMIKCESVVIFLPKPFAILFAQVCICVEGVCPTTSWGTVHSESEI